MHTVHSRRKAHELCQSPILCLHDRATTQAYTTENSPAKSTLVSPSRSNPSQLCTLWFLLSSVPPIEAGHATSLFGLWQSLSMSYFNTCLFVPSLPFTCHVSPSDPFCPSSLLTQLGRHPCARMPVPLSRGRRNPPVVPTNSPTHPQRKRWPLHHHIEHFCSVHLYRQAASSTTPFFLPLLQMRHVKYSELPPRHIHSHPDLSLQSATYSTLNLGPHAWAMVLCNSYGRAPAFGTQCKG